MPKGMEFLQEPVHLGDMIDRLSELSLDNWELVTVLAAHANMFEIGDLATVIIVMKRPKRGN
jgi:hypothetical protein